QVTIRCHVDYMVAMLRLDPTQDLAGAAVDLHDPAIRSSRLISVLGSNPQGAPAEGHRSYPPQVRYFAQIFSRGVESLQTPILPVRHPDHALVIHRDSVWLVELSGTRTRAAPFPQALSVGGVFEDPGIAVAIGDEQMSVRGEGDVGRAV